MGIEAVSVIAANSLYETKNVIRSKYPSLASKADQLYQTYLSDKELTGIFSSPAQCSILFYLNVADVREQGYRINNNNFYRMCYTRRKTAYRDIRSYANTS